MEKYKTVSRNKSTNFLFHDNFAKEESLKVKKVKNKCYELFACMPVDTPARGYLAESHFPLDELSCAGQVC